MDLLDSPVRNYAWGSLTTLPELLGTEPDGDPHAELWVGAHPGSPSLLPDGTALHEVVARTPDLALGADVRERFGDRLPYLLKVLAAEAPLSIQVHPDARRAAERFAAEQAAGSPVAERSYTDPHHKPEMLLALTRFEALCGFRPPADAAADLSGLAVPGVRPLAERLAAADETDALRGALSYVLAGGDDVRTLVREVAAAARARATAVHDEVLARLDDAYPGDPGVLVALLLHHVRLDPGQALYLPAGNLHAYLHGTGVELMASSDNVLRGGLTPKRVDVPELLAVVDFRSTAVPLVEPQVDGSVTVWRPGAREFELLDVLPGSDAPVEVDGGGPRVVLCLDGVVRCRAGGDDLVLRRGAAAFVADADGPLTLAADADGRCRAVVAAVPTVSAPR